MADILPLRAERSQRGLRHVSNRAAGALDMRAESALRSGKNASGGTAIYTYRNTAKFTWCTVNC